MNNSIGVRTVFMGTSFFAKIILSFLIKEKYNLVSVYTRPDGKIGRKQIEQKSPVKILAEEFKIKIYEPLKFDAEEISKLKEQKPDIIIVAAYGKILPQEILDIPGFGAINIHASLLPKFRGPSPLQNALLQGIEKTGTTIMLMNSGIDTGNILRQKEIPLYENEKYPEVLERVAEESAHLLLDTLPFWIERKIKSIPQKESEASYCQLIEKSDGKIIWSDEITSIYNKWRAFYPWPGIFSYWERDGMNLRLIFHKIKVQKKQTDFFEKIPMGKVFQQEGEVAIRAGNGAIILEEIQLEGKAKVSIKNFINGYPEFIGSILK